jgi:hypothetical protein
MGRRKKEGRHGTLLTCIEAGRMRLRMQAAAAAAAA